MSMKKHVRTQTPEHYNQQVDSYRFCVLIVLWGLTTVPPINGSTRSSGGNGGITSDGCEGYSNLPVIGCGNFTTMAQVVFVKEVRCVEKCRRIYHAKMFLIIKINAKVLTQLQTNTNQTKTTDEKTRELLCLLPQKITKNLLQNKLQRPSDKEPPNINTSPART
jgi:hypothetical protein